MKFPWAAVFDWDGVILDSSCHHEESWERLARETGKILPAGHFRRGFGRRNIVLDAVTSVPHRSNCCIEPRRITTTNDDPYAVTREAHCSREAEPRGSRRNDCSFSVDSKIHGPTLLANLIASEERLPVG